MDDSNDKELKKNKFTIVKTFPVPFSLEEVSDNFSIFTNKFSKKSNNEIINQAIYQHSKGNISEAIKSYKYSIDQGINNPTVFLNYGTILYDLGQLKEAESLIKKSIRLNPDMALAHSNLGVILNKLGRLKEAEISSRKAIDLNPDSADFHSNLGMVLRDSGEFNEAEMITRKAINLNPNFGEAYANLGNILRDLGRLKEAEESSRKAIQLSPDSAIFYSNLGGILNELGEFLEAEKITRKAIEIDPNFADAYANLGNILVDLLRFSEAFYSFLEAIKISPENSNYYSLITRLLRDSDTLSVKKEDLKYILNTLLKREDIHHDELFKIFNCLYPKKLIGNLKIGDNDIISKDFIIELINDNFLLEAMKRIIFKDIKWEIIFNQLRRLMLEKIALDANKIDYNEIHFISSLAHQCFLNEYIYSQEDEERKDIKKIIDRCKNDSMSEQDILILACYWPLHKLSEEIPQIKKFISLNNDIKSLINMQLVEPLEELKLSKNITRIGQIKNDISIKVKSQYEENPYPRWRSERICKGINYSAIQIINSEIRPNSITTKLRSNPLKILIAGCGTGMQIFHAQKYRNSQITAIDLSAASLSYAQRKINQFGINNVKLIQMDILEVELLKEKFDIIECCGVLHHMDKPINGLKALLNVLSSEGFMRLSLYSELSRQSIIKAREYIKFKNYNPSIENIRTMRKDIINGKLPGLFSLTDPDSDFFTTSVFRDLCFHYKEHRFTFDQLEEILNSNKLKFLGFLLHSRIKSIYRQYFPDDKLQDDLKRWSIVEGKNLGIFSSTPPFWVCRSK